MLLTMFPMGSGTTASTSTEREHIDIEPCSSGAGKWTDGNEQATLQEGFAHTLEDTARAYPDLDLTQALHIEPRDYQQAALDAWIDHDRRGSVVLPTGSGKTFLGLQAIADAGVSTLVVTPTIDLMNQWHATLTNAFGDQLTEPVGVLGGGSHDVTAITVTTYDSAYRYVSEYGDQFGLLVVDEEHHLPAPTYRRIPEMIIAPYRLGLTATYERPDGKHELLEDLLGGRLPEGRRRTRRRIPQRVRNDPHVGRPHG